MDNLTHSLFGAAVAEAYIQTKLPTAPKSARRLLYTTSILANNFPDFDFLLGLVDNTRLGYLLNHRGWTHTVLGAFLQSVLLVGLLYFILKWFKSPHKNLIKPLAILALIGCQTHMLLDYFNSYGVHPFWPLDASWYYLDSVFIIEPLLWIVVCALWVRAKRWTGLLLLPIVLAYAYGWQRDLVTPSVLAVAGLLMIFCFGLYKKLTPRRRSHVALLLFTAIVLTFWGHQKVAQQKITAHLASLSSAKTLDIVLTSLPSNPTCWFFLAPQIMDSSYQVVAGSIALYGSAAECKTWPVGKSLASNLPPPANTESLQFRGGWIAPLEELRPLFERCDVSSWFKFVRVPFWKDGALNDLRFAIRDEQNFTTLNLQEGDPKKCPPIWAPWAPPRQDILDAVKQLPSPPQPL